MQDDPHHASDDADDPFSVRVLHSALAIIVVVVVALIVVAASVSPGTRTALAGWHHGLGLIAWGFTYALLAARAANRQRAVARVMPGLDVLARLVSLPIYICLLAIPPIGFLAASARGRTIPIFTDGLLRALPLHDLPNAASVLATIHRGLAWGLLGLIAVHLGLSILRRVAARSGAGRLVDAPRRVL